MLIQGYLVVFEPGESNMTGEELCRYDLVFWLHTTIIITGVPFRPKMRKWRGSVHCYVHGSHGRCLFIGTRVFGGISI